MKPKTDKLLSDVEKKFGIRCGKHHPRLKLSTYLKRKGYSSMSRLLEMTKPKTDKQGWEEEFDNKVKEMPKKLIELVEWNKIKDFIRLQREQVRREVVEEVRQCVYDLIGDEAISRKEIDIGKWILDTLLSKKGEKKGDR